MVSLNKASIAMVLGLGLMGCGSAAVAPSTTPAADPSVAIGAQANARKTCREDHSSAGAAIFTPNDPWSGQETNASQQTLAYCSPKRSVR